MKHQYELDGHARDLGGVIVVLEIERDSAVLTVTAKAEAHREHGYVSLSDVEYAVTSEPKGYVGPLTEDEKDTVRDHLREAALGGNRA